MSETHDLRPVARTVADLVASIGDEQLAAPTPCPEYTVGDLLDHVAGLSVAFTVAATKESLPGGASGPSGDASRLYDDWRTTIPTRLNNYEPNTDAVVACRDFVLQFSGPGSEEQRAGGFGPVVTSPAGATPLEELIALSGRDPNWTPS